MSADKPYPQLQPSLGQLGFVQAIFGSYINPFLTRGRQIMPTLSGSPKQLFNCSAGPVDDWLQVEMIGNYQPSQFDVLVSLFSTEFQGNANNSLTRCGLL